ncbi:MAG: nicotinate phosphoribosyltransferase [Spirochaetales bacterium]|nr:nicotinate phosphoribosyltransferase [Spirochaetales bacterium]
MSSECSFNCVMLTDYYELTMMQGYYLHDHNPRAAFEMFFRRCPFDGGFAVFAGLEPLVRTVLDFRFSDEDLEFLAGQKIFRREFLDYLAGFRFSGDIHAVDEGSIVFPNEPLLRVEAPLMEAQLLESLLLNILNYQTLIATKAARIYLASERGRVLEFGMRRAHGVNGALSAARAAYIGGAAATSNTLAGKRYGIPVSGTMAHSWVMSFENELAAFRRYAEVYPENCILLIDTYDTLQSGLENAITVGQELKARGHTSFGVRLDSGDLEYLSKKVRARLDQAGLEQAQIAASNELDEGIIHQLLTEGAPIDMWGVGTHLVTGKDDPALTGVYKLMAIENGDRFVPTIKVSNNPDKITDPGIKQVHRFYNGSGSPVADLLTLEDENVEPGKAYRFYHPKYPYRYIDVREYDRIEPLLKPVMRAGRTVAESPDLKTLQARALANLQSLDHTYTRLINPHVYKVSLSERLKDLKFGLIAEYERATGRA